MPGLSYTEISRLPSEGRQKVFADALLVFEEKFKNTPVEKLTIEQVRDYVGYFTNIIYGSQI
jgi:hypothetical protein